MKETLKKNAKVVGSASGDFYTGAKYPLKALVFFLKNPRYWRYMAIPVAISVILYSVLFFLMIGELRPFLMGLMPKTGDWSAVWVYSYDALKWILNGLFIILSCIIILFTFTVAYSIVACPFLDMMSIKLEADRYGFEFDDCGWAQMLKDIWMSMKNNIWLNVVSIFWMIVFFPLNLLVPVVGFIPGFLFAAYFFGLSFLIYSAEHRRIQRQDFGLVFKEKRWLILGFGVVVYAVLPIPFLAILFLPIAVLGGTMLYNEQFADTVNKRLNESCNEIEDQR